MPTEDLVLLGREPLAPFGVGELKFRGGIGVHWFHGSAARGPGPAPELVPVTGFHRSATGKAPGTVSVAREAVMDENSVSMDEVEAEGAVSLPNKEVLSLLDVNANVDLGLDLAAPVDLAAAANLNVAAPIEAAATANVLSPGAEAVGLAHQSGAIDQHLSGTADATAPQHAQVAENSGTGQAAGSGTATPAETGTTGTAAPADAAAAPAAPADAHVAPGAPAPAAPAEAAPGAAAPAEAAPAEAAPPAGEVGAAAGAVGHTVGDAAGAAAPAAGAAGQAVGDVANAAAPVAGDVANTAAPVADAAGGAVDSAGSTTTGGVDSLLNGGSLLDANVNIHAAANVAAPIDGAVAANGNVAAPVDAAVGANVGSQGAVSEALAPQEVDIQQNLDHVSADATATQDASVSQK
jgi:hypothetical protein